MKLARVILALGTVILLSSVSQARGFMCDIQQNGTTVFRSEVQTQGSKRTFIGRAGMIDAYITEKSANYFVLEAFLASAEARIYAEGFIKAPQDKLGASFWSRDALVEIQCLQTSR